METTIDTMHLDGGYLCLDFINTVHSRTETPIRDYLLTYEDVLRWTNRTGILSKKEQKYLSDYAADHPDRAKKAFKKIINAREALFTLFGAIAEDRKPAIDSIEIFNRLLTKALVHVKLVPAKDKMQVVWEQGSDPLMLPLWMAVKSAYDILIEEPQDRIKACPSCYWLFLDKTKNNKRRWCNSLTCGSIDKASRYYYRKKKESKN